MSHFIALSDVAKPTLDRILETARQLRRQRRMGQANAPILGGRTLAMIFEKPSLRTRVSFEQAMNELGGRAIVMTDAEVGLGRRESPADVARVLSGMVHGIMARVFEHQKLVEMAQAGSVPVINALSDYSHPCQALADILTLQDEFGTDLTGRTLVFLGDGNNVARSLAVACGHFGMRFVLCCARGYELDRAFEQRLQEQVPGMDYQVIHEPMEAVHQADAIYTDTWVSMGQESQAQRKLRDLAPYQLSQALMDAASPDAVALHCLPAYRGKEIAADVIDGPRSRVFPQAHNRLHLQKGLLAVLMGPNEQG